MSPEKCILLLTSQDSTLTTLGASLQADGYQVSVVQSEAEALLYIQHNAKLSLLVVEHETAGVETETLAHIKAQAADLPVIWVVPEGADEPDFGLMEASAVFNAPVVRADFVAKTEELLPNQLYPSSLTITLVSAANAVMATTFQASVDVGRPWFKLNSMLPGEFHALLPFMGENAAGHLLIGGSTAHLVLLGLDLGFEESEGNGAIVREVLGEIANQVVGRIKQDCGSYLTDLRVGLPLIFTGKELTISYPSSKPSLCVEVSDSRGTLHVEFSFQRANVSEDNTEISETGEVVLF